MTRQLAIPSVPPPVTAFRFPTPVSLEESPNSPRTWRAPKIPNVPHAAAAPSVPLTEPAPHPPLAALHKNPSPTQQRGTATAPVQGFLNFLTSYNILYLDLSPRAVVSCLEENNKSSCTPTSTSPTEISTVVQLSLDWIQK